MKEAHGGDIWAASQKTGLKPGDLVDFSASINPAGMSRKAIRAIKDALGPTVSAYPDPSMTELKKAVSTCHGLPSKNILPANGSTELIYLLPRVLKPSKALIVEPAFSEYRKALRLAGSKVSSHVLKEEYGFSPDIERLKARLAKGGMGGFDLLYIANPANPTGAPVDRDGLVELADVCSRLGTTMVVDEAFTDFAEELSVKKEVLKYKNLIVLRSMTKFFAMAGLRLGYLFAHEKTLERFKYQLPPWSVNTLASVAGAASIQDRPYMKRSLKAIETEKRFLEERLSALNGIKLYPSSANFFMLKITAPGETSPRLKERLLEKGILIRDLSDFNGLGTEYFRIAVRTRRENILLLNALDLMLEKGPALMKKSLSASPPL